jgi:DNA-binding GntR family transcriptional regulator
MAKRGSAATLSTAVWQQLRQEILDGTIPPGARLKPTELAVRFEVSTGVIREALTRLSEQRLVSTGHNQGFRVIELSPARLTDLTEFRATVEQLALRMAISRGDLQWESDVIAAHHRMAATPRRAADRSDVTTEAWSRAHREFHHTLIRACGYDDLLNVCLQLNDSAEIYRRWSAPAAGRNRDVDAEHQAILDAAVRRDADRACRALESHYQRTAAVLLSPGIPEASPDPVNAASDSD